MLTGLVLDQIDSRQSQEILSLGIKTCLADTLMRTIQDRARLAKEVVEFSFTFP